MFVQKFELRKSKEMHGVVVLSEHFTSETFFFFSRGGFENHAFSLEFSDYLRRLKQVFGRERVGPGDYIGIEQAYIKIYAYTSVFFAVESIETCFVPIGANPSSLEQLDLGHWNRPTTRRIVSIAVKNFVTTCLIAILPLGTLVCI